MSGPARDRPWILLDLGWSRSTSCASGERTGGLHPTHLAVAGKAQSRWSGIPTRGWRRRLGPASGPPRREAARSGLPASMLLAHRNPSTVLDREITEIPLVQRIGGLGAQRLSTPRHRSSTGLQEVSEVGEGPRCETGDCGNHWVLLRTASFTSPCREGLSRPGEGLRRRA